MRLALSNFHNQIYTTATIDLGKAIFEFFSGVAGENFNKKYLATYLTKNYFQLPDFDIEELFRSIEGEEGEEEEPEICPGSREIGLLDPKYSSSLLNINNI